MFKKENRLSELDQRLEEARNLLNDMKSLKSEMAHTYRKSIKRLESNVEDMKDKIYFNNEKIDSVYKDMDGYLRDWSKMISELSSKHAEMVMALRIHMEEELNQQQEQINELRRAVGLEVPKEENKKEIKGCHDKIKALTNHDMILFRAPYGDYNESLVETAKECNYYTIQWDVDSLDWKDYGEASIVKTVLEHKHLGNGSIILLHNGATYTRNALPTLLKGLKEAGYEMVPVSKLIYKEQFEMNHEGRQVKK